MRLFCIVLGNEDSGNYFYVQAERIVFSTILYSGKLGDIQFYVGSKLVCFVDHHKVYTVQELEGDEKVLYKEGEILC